MRSLGKHDVVECPICGRDFKRIKKGGSHSRRPAGLRTSLSKTCSPKCSRISDSRSGKVKCECGGWKSKGAKECMRCRKNGNKKEI